MILTSKSCTHSLTSLFKIYSAAERIYGLTTCQWSSSFQSLLPSAAERQQHIYKVNLKSHHQEMQHISD